MCTEKDTRKQVNKAASNTISSLKQATDHLTNMNYVYTYHEKQKREGIPRIAKV